MKGGFTYACVINFLPTIGVLGSHELQSLYGVSITDPNEVLMMRHRAVLFGVVGGMLGGAVMWKRWRPLSSVVGLSSMASYVLLVASQSLSGNEGLSLYNDKIRRVFWIDVVGVVWLGCAAVLSWSSSNESGDRDVINTKSL